MQLKLQRTQRMGGLMGNTVLFCLDVRAEYSGAETENIRKYRLGNETIYSSQAARRHTENAGAHLDRTQAGGAGERAAGLAHGIYSLAMANMHLNISIASLGRGQHIECKDLAELMEAEDAVMNACRNLRDYLAVAASFNGSIVLVDFSQGETVHQSGGALQIADGMASGQSTAAPREAQRSETPIDGEVLTPEEAAAEAAVYDFPPFKPLGEMIGEWPGIFHKAYKRNPVAFYMGGLVMAALAVVFVFGFNLLSILSAGSCIAATIVLGRRRGAL